MNRIFHLSMKHINKVDRAYSFSKYCSFYDRLCNIKQSRGIHLQRHRFNRNLKNNSASEEPSLLKKRYVYVHTCYNFWVEVPGGLAFDVEYYDSHPNANYDYNIPLVLALHNSPGCQDDLLPILQPFVKLGCRVIAPNFPESGNTKWIQWRKKDIFTGGLEEKGLFIKDFLSTLNIQRVDLIFGHGAASNTAVMLASDNPNMFKSFAVICPSGLKPKNLRHHNQYKILTKMWDKLHFQPFIMLYLFLKKNKWGYSSYPVKQIISAVRAEAVSVADRVSTYLIAARNANIPRCIVYCENDENTKAYVTLLGFAPEDFTVYGKDKTILQKGKSDFPKGLKFDSETETPINQYSKQIVKLLWELMNTALKKNPHTENKFGDNVRGIKRVETRGVTGEEEVETRGVIGKEEVETRGVTGEEEVELTEKNSRKQIND